MYATWAAYDTNGEVGYVYRGKHSTTNLLSARNEAISFADANKRGRSTR